MFHGISNFLEEISAATAKWLQSCPTLCDPIDGSPLGYPVLAGQARTLEWVAISFSNAWKWKVKVKSLSHSRLLATPWTAAYQAPLSMDFPGKSTGVGCHCLLRKRSLVIPILLFSSISLHWLLKKAFLSLLAILWNSAFRCLYLSFAALLFTSLLFTAICKASPDSHFAFLHFSDSKWYWTSFHVFVSHLYVFFGEVSVYSV